MSAVKLFFAGDFCSKPSTSRISVSEDLQALIHACDFKVINFEVPLKPEIEMPPQKRERFYQNDDVPDFLREVGFNLFSLANNHAFDWGEEGFKKTKEALGDAAFGAGSYDEAYSVKVVEKDGVRIGFLALSFAAYTGVFDDEIHHEGLGCAYINDLKVNHIIIGAKKEVDYLFILPHDGIEYIDIPMPGIIARYRDFIDYGADGVIGTHPHCPQGWEVYKGKPIFYSLGNFLFNSKDGYEYRAWNRPHWYEGLCVILELDAGSVCYQIVNTRNVDNLQVIIDCDPSRVEHNQRINQYLLDKEQYSNYLDKQCHRLSVYQELPIIDKTFHYSSLWSCSKLLVKKWIRRLKGSLKEDDFELISLLRNQTRNSVLLHYLRNNRS